MEISARRRRKNTGIFVILFPKKMGILTKVVADEELYDEALKQAEALAQGPTKAYGTVKKLLLQDVMMIVSMQ